MSLSPFSPIFTNTPGFELYNERDRFNRQIVPYWMAAGDSVNMATTMTKVIDDKNRYGINLDVSHFKPEELKVSLDGHILTVEGSHEIRDHDQYLKRTFVRKWTLPEECDLHNIHSALSKEGRLVIDAPKQGAPTSRVIPIEPTP